MTRLISRTAMPPGGWQFRQIETGWVLPKPKQQSFSTAARLIQQHRMANTHLPLSTNLALIQDELEQYTVLRINHNPAFCVTLTPVLASTYVPKPPPKSCRSCG